MAGAGPETWAQEIKSVSLDAQPAGGGEDKADDQPEGTVEG
jgi:hypothetical protein